MARTPAYDEAYPRQLWEYEREHLPARTPKRELPPDRPSPDVLGVALSGGGIRSATFCLGVFQALAQLRRLDRIDYISTVSGGGYFGSFLGRLYQRREITNSEQVRALLDPTAAPAQQLPVIPNVLGWLRENGRYLSPNGAGDLLIGGAILLRNWATIQIVVMSFALLVLMSGQLLRLALELSPRLSSAFPGGAGPSWLWWSPWIIVPGITLVGWAIPCGWAFWLTGRWTNRRKAEWPVWGVAAAALVAIGLIIRPELVAGGVSSRGLRLLGGATLVVIALTIVAREFARRWAVTDERAFPSPSSQKVFEIDRQRNLLSTWLKFALVTTGALLTYALVDSVGQTIYLVARSTERTLTPLYSALAVLAGAAAFAQRVATWLGGRANGGRLRLPVAALVTAGALAITALLLVSLSVLAHGLAWRFQKPSGGPTITWVTPASSPTTINVQIPVTAGGAVTATTAPPPSECPCPVAVAVSRDDPTYLFTALAVWVILLAFGLLFGQCWPFINQSSLHSMYSARLTRAYLGASNPRRRDASRGDVTEVVPGDNIDTADYWPKPAVEGGNPKARPLHLINATINETVDGRSNVQRQDRKGTGLALGPCALSVGVRHHAVFPSHDVFRPPDERESGPPGEREMASRRSTAELTPDTVTVFPRPREDDATAPYQVFENASTQHGWHGGERLSIGAWTGISGAAFSTGLGARTSLGLSLLCGLSNVRLGYWWNSELTPSGRSSRPRARTLERLFAVQSYLLSEFLSRFYGTSRNRWYLSDGGHFENMGGYELIRRRLGRIVLVDAEADPDYTFEGLANLVRKARLDFGATIAFLSEEELKTTVPDSHRALFGTLEQLRRGKWTREPVEDRLTKNLRLTVKAPVDEARYSLAHAALARITYIDDPNWEGWLLYIKPTLTGSEPADILQYHRGHPAFPQETTADQFFDEAQWESYRMLGYHIALDVFGPEGVAAPGAPSNQPIPAVWMFGS